MVDLEWEEGAKILCEPFVCISAYYWHGLQLVVISSILLTYLKVPMVLIVPHPHFPRLWWHVVDGDTVTAGRHSIHVLGERLIHQVGFIGQHTDEVPITTF